MTHRAGACRFSFPPMALFFASFLSWMVIQLHKNDWKKIPKEEEFMAAAAACNHPGRQLHVSDGKRT